MANTVSEILTSLSKHSILWAQCLRCDQSSAQPDKLVSNTSTWHLPSLDTAEIHWAIKFQSSQRFIACVSLILPLNNSPCHRSRLWWGPPCAMIRGQLSRAVPGSGAGAGSERREEGSLVTTHAMCGAWQYGGRIMWSPSGSPECRRKMRTIFVSLKYLETSQRMNPVVCNLSVISAEESWPFSEICVNFLHTNLDIWAYPVHAGGRYIDHLIFNFLRFIKIRKYTFLDSAFYQMIITT